jgi:hypothetical protein
MPVDINQQQGYGLGSVGSPIFGASLPPIVTTRNPGTTDFAPIGSQWMNSSTNSIFFLTSVAAGVATWTGGSGGAGAFATLSSVTTTTVGSTLAVGTNATIGGTLAVTAGSTFANVINVGTYTQTAGNVSINADANPATILIGTGAGVIKTITVGGTGANVITIGNTQTAGSVAIGTAMTSGTISIGGTGAHVGLFSIAPGTGAQTLNIANSTGVKTVNIATGAAANVVTLGSTNTAAQTIIQAGSVGILLNCSDIILAPDVHTVASPTASVTGNYHVIRTIFTGFTTANAGGAQAYTVNSNKILVTSGCLVQVTNLNASTNGAYLTITGVIQAAGSLVINTANNGAGALGAGDNVIVTVWVIS